MAITDELREWVRFGDGSLLAIADRIDAEHEAMLVDARKTVYQGYIELPKDAGGEYIHVGDMLADGLSQSFTPKKVKMLMLEDNEWMLNFGGGWCAMKHHKWHHYHAPTVEDTLREMLDKWGEMPSNMTNEAIVAEYAAKLQLRGDAE